MDDRQATYVRLRTLFDHTLLLEQVCDAAARVNLIRGFDDIYERLDITIYSPLFLPSVPEQQQWPDGGDRRVNRLQAFVGLVFRLKGRG